MMYPPVLWVQQMNRFVKNYSAVVTDGSCSSRSRLIFRNCVHQCHHHHQHYHQHQTIFQWNAVLLPSVGRWRSVYRIAASSSTTDNLLWMVTDLQCLLINSGRDMLKGKRFRFFTCRESCPRESHTNGNARTLMHAGNTSIVLPAGEAVYF